MPNQRKSLSDWESLKCLDTSTKKGKAPGISKRIIMKKIIGLVLRYFQFQQRSFRVRLANFYQLDFRFYSQNLNLKLIFNYLFWTNVFIRVKQFKKHFQMWFPHLCKNNNSVFILLKQGSIIKYGLLIFGKIITMCSSCKSRGA